MSNQDLDRNVIELCNHLNKQDELEKESIELEKVLIELVDEECVYINSDEVKSALSVCDEEFYELMGIHDIDVSKAPVDEVKELARLAQDFKDKLQQVLRDEMEPKAREVRRSGGR